MAQYEAGQKSGVGTIQGYINKKKLKDAYKDKKFEQYADRYVKDHPRQANKGMAKKSSFNKILKESTKNQHWG